MVFHVVCVLLCFINPRARKIRNEVSSCPGTFSVVRATSEIYVGKRPLALGVWDPKPFKNKIQKIQRSK